MLPIALIGLVVVIVGALALMFTVINDQQDLNEINIENQIKQSQRITESLSIRGAIINNTKTIELENLSNEIVSVIQLRAYDEDGEFLESSVIGVDVNGNTRITFDNSLKLVKSYSMIGVTSNGVEFKIDSFGNDNGEGESMVDGMGIDSRIIQNEPDGWITFGTGNIGQDNSIIPYITVNSNTDFTSLIENDDTIQSFVIPHFWREYEFYNNGLVETTSSSNVLGYSQSRDIVGSNSVNINNNGIIISGNGKSILKLHNYTSSTVLLTGNLTQGNVKLITSDNVDFINDMYGVNGFTVPSSLPVVVGADSTHYATASWTSGYTYRSQSCAGPVNGYYYVATSYTPYSSSSTVTATITETNEGDHALITSLSGYSATAPASTGSSVWAWCQFYLNSGIQDGWVSGVTLAIYDTLPAYTIFDYSDSFVRDYTFPIQQTYLYVEPSGGIITIHGESITNTPILKITNLESNVPFQIIKDGLPIVTGMTDEFGEIVISESAYNDSFLTSGILYLYPDSLSYRGAFSTIVFDNLNKQTIHINTVEDLVYTVHAYVNIPVTGDVEITNVMINGNSNSENLDYLNGNYTSGNEIKVPVIPKFNSVSLKINGVDTSLDFSNVLGGTGIKIALENSSTIKKSDVNNRITSMESIVGTTAFVIASSQGTINALVTESISGDITITNNYQLEAIPPTPPTPPRVDPLSGWVDVHVNGEFQKSVSLGINPYPDFTSSGTINGNNVVQNVVYSYPDYVVIGTVSIDVDSGDFVEFYLYADIYGEIESYSTPGGFVLVSESGYGVATVNIKSASIQTSMG